MPPVPAEQILPLTHHIKDSSRLIGLSVSKIYQLAADGKLKIIRIAGRSLIEHTELQRLIAEARGASGQAETGRAIGARKVRAVCAERAKALAANPAAATLTRRRRRVGRAQTPLTGA